ncbi:MAG TPA: glycosyltransferase family 4 protein [Thermotogota bacterium]|nr:glycosyltransferase family 4 protein [Thermotogota bacterium]HRW93680.1 glycosyltransferase family 4 protein [Thermotogota bacterium]
MYRINVISSSYKFKGQGVQSAFRSHIKLLDLMSDQYMYEINNRQDRFDIIHIHTPDVPHFYHAFRHHRHSLLVMSAHVVPDSVLGTLILAPIWYPVFSKYLISLYNYCDLVIAVSQNVRQELMEAGVQEEKIKIIPNYIFRNDYQMKVDAEQKKALRRKYGIPEDAFVAVGAGQVQPRKGIDAFLQVANRMKDENAFFVWCGHISFKGYTSHYAKMKRTMENSPSNVFFPGLIPDEKIKEYYALSDVFFFPSRQETFGLVVPEAGGSGIPIVLRDLEVYRAIFKENFLKAADVDGFVHQLRALKNDPALYSKYAKRSSELFEEYVEDSRIEMYDRLYQEGYVKKFGTVKKLHEQRNPRSS